MIRLDKALRRQMFCMLVAVAAVPWVGACGGETTEAIKKAIDAGPEKGDADPNYVPPDSGDQPPPPVAPRAFSDLPETDEILVDGGVEFCGGESSRKCERNNACGKDGDCAEGLNCLKLGDAGLDVDDQVTGLCEPTTSTAAVDGGAAVPTVAKLGEACGANTTCWRSVCDGTTSKCSYPRSCADVTSKPNGVYSLQRPDVDGGGTPYSAFCDKLNGELVMKVNGNNQTLGYGAAYWTADASTADGGTLNPSRFGFSNSEAKFASFYFRPVTTVTVVFADAAHLTVPAEDAILPKGFSIDITLDAIVANKVTANPVTLASLIQDTQYRFIAGTNALGLAGNVNGADAGSVTATTMAPWNTGIFGTVPYRPATQANVCFEIGLGVGGNSNGTFNSRPGNPGYVEMARIGLAGDTAARTVSNSALGSCNGSYFSFGVGLGKGLCTNSAYPGTFVTAGALGCANLSDGDGGVQTLTSQTAPTGLDVTQPGNVNRGEFAFVFVK